MLNESQQKPKPRRQHIVPTRKRQDETNDVQTEIEKRKEKKKKWSKSTSTTQERRQHVRGIRIVQARKERGGGVASRRKNRITESATKESREAKRKAKRR